ncbi:MAG TPA: hypothetical protein PK413_19515 [Thermoanaerobaculia bacterium]|nr:hypothetical protein [Thermoanaerobaculia bacterium]
MVRLWPVRQSDNHSHPAPPSQAAAIRAAGHQRKRGRAESILAFYQLGWMAAIGSRPATPTR